MNSFAYAFPSILLIGVANVILKWRLDQYSKMNIGIFGKESLRVIFDPFVIIGYVATGASILWWLSIMPKVKVSVVYPMIQAGVIIVTAILSLAFLNERLNSGQILGISLLVSGVVIASWSS